MRYRTPTNADKIAPNENTALDEKSQIAETIRAIDDFYRQADELYRQTAWRMGLPDCAFDIVYALVNEDGLTQKQLCELGFSSKQTVHSSIKRMVDKGVVELRGNTPRTQRVYLTGYGRNSTKPTFKPYWPPSMKPSQSSPMKSSANLPVP